MGRRRRPSGRPVTGILLLDKPTGITSNQALQAARRCFRAAKGGHTGSLDPAASGMLPLCFGEATKVSAFLLDADKEYDVVARLGERTDTADADGAVVESSPVKEVGEGQLRAVLPRFTGEIEQVPPMYSALKKDGRRLHELARQGIEVEREPRQITVHELELVEYDPQMPRFHVRCSKGTYVRTLVEDIASALGTLGHVAALRRTAVDPFAGMPMVPLAEVEQLSGDTAALDRLLLPVEKALQGHPAVRLSAVAALRVSQGQSVDAGSAPAGLVRLHGPDGTLIGMGEVHAGEVAPKRLFRPV